jgi:hypothetical protein
MKKTVLLPVACDFCEPALYAALAHLGAIGCENTIIRAVESAIPRMAEINGHRHALGRPLFKFEPVLCLPGMSKFGWEVETPDGICQSDPPVW